MIKVLSISALIKRDMLSLISKLEFKTPMVISIHGKLKKTIVVSGSESHATTKLVMSQSSNYGTVVLEVRLAIRCLT